MSTASGIASARRWPVIALLIGTATACSSSSGSSSEGRTSGAGGGDSSGGSAGSGGASGGGGSFSSGGIKGTGGHEYCLICGGAFGAGGIGGGGAAGGGAGGAPEDAGAISCWGATRSFPTFDKSCGADSDCALVYHRTDCCGSETLMAVNHAAVDSFKAAETVCDSQYPACGCAPRGTSAEDGTLLPYSVKDTVIVAKCDQGTCTSKYGGAHFACGDGECPDLDYCSVRTPGTGGVTSYGCQPLYGCTDCTCAGTPTGCNCSKGAAGITVTCYGQ